jgi:hypothetical protein
MTVKHHGRHGDGIHAKDRVEARDTIKIGIFEKTLKKLSS